MHVKAQSEEQLESRVPLDRDPERSAPDLAQSSYNIPDPKDKSAEATVFLSYSRRDMPFVDRLDAALKAHGVKTLVDRSAIEVGEAWLPRLKDLISRADTIVFILSPDSATSPVCAEEISYGSRLRKRFIPVVARRVPDATVPETLRALNYVFLDDEGTFGRQVERLVWALRTDLGWLRLHADIGRLAEEWDSAGRPTGLLLGGAKLDEAQAWIGRRPANAPLPSENTRGLIERSGRLARLRRRILIATLSAGLIAATGLAAIAFVQRQAAEIQRDMARNNQASALAALSVVTGQSNPALATKLALAAWPRNTADRTRQTRGALSALGTAVYQLRERRILRAGENVQGATFSPDGLRVLTASRTPRIWNSIGGEALAALAGHGGDVWTAAFSPNGARIVTASSDQTARIWDANTGEARAVLSHAGDVWSAAFSSDSRRVVTASADRTAAVWDTDTGRKIATLVGHDQGVSSATFSTDGARVVTTSGDGTVRLWSAKSGRLLLKLEGHDGAVNRASFSPDGAFVASASEDRTARVWNAATGRGIAVLQGHQQGVQTAEFSPDGARVLTSSRDGTARVWDAGTGRTIVELAGHRHPLWGAKFSADGSLVVTNSMDNTARIWNSFSGRQLDILGGHSQPINSAAFSPDGTRVVTASMDGTGRVWDVGRLQPASRLDGLPGPISRASVLPDGTHILTVSGHFAQVSDLRSGEIGPTLREGTEQVYDGVVSPDGQRVATRSDDTTIRVWDAKAGLLVARLQGHTDGIWHLSFSADSRQLVSASRDRTARVWDPESGRQIAILEGHAETVTSAHLSPDGRRIATGSYDRTARIWEASSGRLLATLEGHDGAVDAVQFSPDGARLLAMSTGPARLWDVSTAQQIARLDTPYGGAKDGSFSPDDRLILTIAPFQHVAQLSDARTGRLVGLLEGHTDLLNSAQFSPDGARILTASNDKSARLWDVATAQPLLGFPTENAFAIATFSPNGKLIAIADANRMMFWQTSITPTGNVFDVACELLSDHDLADVAGGFGLSSLDPICRRRPPLPTEDAR